MSATTLNLTIEQGATFSQTIAVGNTYDGYTARAKLRSQFGPCGELLATFTCSAVSSGNVTLSLTAAQTALLLAPTWAQWDERSILIGVWDLELVSGATVVRARQGEVDLSLEATTDD
jgi:hypothetical protein